ncbi:MAG: alpha/beta fold hydrolase [Actinomycetota bacterium]|nr:alpha/beta fold hydrolase [Actinomycetota bacterium]
MSAAGVFGHAEPVDPDLEREAGEPAAAATQALEREFGLLAGLDTMGFASAMTELGRALATRPDAVLGAAARLNANLTAAVVSTAARSMGAEIPSPVDTDGKDRRFRDEAWTRNPWFYGIGQSYQAWTRYMHELVDAADLPQPTGLKADFAVSLLVDAVAPTNFLFTNPTALRRAADTGGRSVVAGMMNFTRDLVTNGGRPKQVDDSAFRVGENLACTPGKVVFRNELMELIQYSPQTETTFEVPLLMSPPWINKYYIMDLAPDRSFVEWAVRRGHTTFAISYRNPDESMRHIALDDYLLHGPHTALDVIRDITGSEQVNMVGLCLGGTLTAMLLAYLASTGEERIRSATLLNTLIDFREPGPMGCFVDQSSVQRLDKKMLRRGFLDANEMSGMFDLLRARDLIWNYVSSGWLMGEDPPAFDVLVWNSDGTRLPADMHSFYLRYCYLENQLARGEMSLAGTDLKLDRIKADVYLLGAKEDHIAPWKSAYGTTQLLTSPVRFVLSSSGHVAGIVNPPGSKRHYWTNDDLPGDPDAWLAGAEEHAGSWWLDWGDWIDARAGERRQPPPMGGDQHPPIADAPGDYVHEK